ncbi:MAG: hypothetical protein GPOALKHO_000351 [Sodalis sp.]|nr:MAG: hypothetical protein GPOALKHO_000351 [Sodalis sp.]
MSNIDIAADTRCAVAFCGGGIAGRHRSLRGKCKCKNFTGRQHIVI